MVGEIEEPSWDLTKKADRGDGLGEQKLVDANTFVDDNYEIRKLTGTYSVAISKQSIEDTKNYFHI